MEIGWLGSVCSTHAEAGVGMEEALQLALSAGAPHEADPDTGWGQFVWQSVHDRKHGWEWGTECRRKTVDRACCPSGLRCTGDPGTEQSKRPQERRLGS